MRSAPFAALGTALLAAGCSLLLGTADPVQCATTRDCDADPALRNRVCEEGFCVIPRAPIQPVSNDAGSGCVSTQLCTQANSNKASVCKVAGGPCTPWQTEQCPLVTGPWSHPNVVMIGSLLPLQVKQVAGAPTVLPYAQRLRRAIDLGVNELDAAIPGGLFFADGGVRRIAVLHCNSFYDPELARAAMTHLTDVVGVQAVLVGSDEELAAVTAQATAKKTALVCTDCVGPFPPGPAAWRIVPPLALEAPMAAWRVAELEAAIRAAPNPPATIKVGVLLES